MDNKRLSLSNLNDHIDSLRSSEWPTMKRYFRRQIVKCINECKTQACNAKKLVETIKDHTKQKANDRTEDDEDDDVGWGSDFDDDSDENEDQPDICSKGRTSLFEYNLPQSCEDLPLVSKPFTGNFSKGSFRSLNESQLEFDRNYCGNTSESIHQITDFKVNDPLNDRTNSENFVLNETIEKSCANDLNSKPKPSPRLLPKPPSTKPEIPKNKPQIIPRNPFANNGSKTVINSMENRNSSTKRPPSEPPPPPLPKSPPPASPSMKSSSTDLDEVFKETFKFLSEEFPKDDPNYESIVLTEDEYLAPIMNRKNSSSTLSSASLSLRDGESPNGYPQSLSSQTLSQTNGMSMDCDYPPFMANKLNKEESISLNHTNEDTYEPVNESPAHIPLDLTPRPPLPKVKESSLGVTKSKGILQNWNKNSKKNTKDKSDNNENISEHNSVPVLSSDSLNNNISGMTTRPLPPLPPLPSTLPSLPPLSPLSFPSTESLRNFEWFHTVEREDAEALLMTQDEDGAYLVRESKRAGKSNPYTLTIYHNGRVFHLNIRKRLDGLYALGKEKSREKTFKTVNDLVSYHTIEPILLTTRGTPAGKTRLITTPPSS